LTFWLSSDSIEDRANMPSRNIVNFIPGPIVDFPDSSWPEGAPADYGVDGGRLKKIPIEVLRHSTIIRDGVEIFTTGEPDRRMGWASCARPFVTTAYLSAIHAGLIPRAFVDAPIAKVFPDSPAAQLFADDVHGCHLLSYTSGGAPICGFVAAAGAIGSCSTPI
jgi:hypothetical protein